MAYFEGDYQTAEALFIKSSHAIKYPLVHYLFAAQCALQRQDIIAMNRYLDEAKANSKSDPLAVAITTVKLQLSQGAYHEASATLTTLLNNAPRHPEVLRLATQAYQKSHRYQELLALIPMLTKTEIYSEKKLNSLQAEAYCGILAHDHSLHADEPLKNWWRALPRNMRHHPQIVAAVAAQFIQYRDDESAFNLIVKTLQQDNDNSLLQLLPELGANYLAKAEQLLEKQLHRHGNQPIVLFVLAQLYIKQQNWQKANELLHQVVQQQADLQAYLLLAESYDRLNQPDDANRVREQALRLMAKQADISVLKR